MIQCALLLLSFLLSISCAIDAAAGYARAELLEKAQRIVHIVDEEVNKGQWKGVLERDHSRLNPSIREKSEMLLIALDSLPRYLCTPWGRIPLLKRCATCCDSAFTKSLFQRLGATFERYDWRQEVYDVKNDYRVVRQYGNTFKLSKERLSKKQLEGLKGTSTIIVENEYGCLTYYKVN